MELPNEEKSISKYKVVKKYILSLIQDNQLMPEDKLPMEIDLAKEFGVSITTTRKALSDLVNEGIIYRVKKRGTFVRARVERSVDVQQKIVSFILPLNNRIDNNLLQFVHGAQALLARSDYQMLIEATNDNVELENELIDNAIKNGRLGLLIFPADPKQNSANFLKLKKNNIPFVLIDRYPDNIPVSAVTSNNVDGAFQATEHLIKLGHTKIVFISYRYKNQAEQFRYKGYRDAMVTYGIDMAYTDDDLFSLDEKANICERIRAGRITALVCANDYCALELLEYLTEHGIDVPNDVSIVGFDGQKATQYVTPALTTVLQPFYEIGEKAAEILVDMIENGIQNPRLTFLPIKLKVRKSTVLPKNI